MAKKRMIDGAFRITEAFGTLSYRQRDLWYGLISTADDQGRLIGHAAYVRSQVWPYDDIPLSEVSKDLEALEQAGFILIYTANESKYIQILKWHEQQREATWLAASELPAPDGWVDHARYHGKNGNIILLNWETRDEPQSIPCKQEVSTLPESYLGATYPATSELPTPLPTQLPRLNDDDDDDNEDEDEEKECVNSFSGEKEFPRARELRGAHTPQKTEIPKAEENPREKRFKPPTVEEVRAYCEERKNSVDAEKFVDFYASKGWMVGSNRMKDWQASVRTWERKDSDFRNSANRGPAGKGTAAGSGKSINSSNERRKTLVELYDEREAAKRAEAEANAKIIDGTFADARSEPVYVGLQTAGGGGR